METIIIQDTDKSILDVLTLALEAESFKVYAILHFDSNFMQLINEVRPHVVMLDYKLDGQECIETFKQIKTKYPHLPVIAISCNTNIHDLYHQHGFADYIKKPFDLDLLYHILRKHIHKVK